MVGLPLFAERIDKRLAKAIGRQLLARFQVNRKELPHYRFVDLYRAIEHFVSNFHQLTQIVSEHQNEDLHRILHEEPLSWATRKIRRSGNLPWPIAAGEECYLPTDSFWVLTLHPGSERAQSVIRLHYRQFEEKAVLEIGSTDPDWIANALETVLNRSIEASIYRNRVLEIAYESAIKDEYGDIERQERLRILFKHLRPLAEEDLIVDKEVLSILQRNILDLHLRRETLKSHGVPLRRGVLFYGPPGTGKTFACRYICGKLDQVTKIIVTGSALSHVNSVFTLARMLQPSLLILEDVDLVFSSREINPYNSAMGELLDHMDGLRPFEDIGFILTTNAIDRMEAAIKDRPGRISQCIYFGPPEPKLRARYLQRYLQPYEPLAFSIEELVSMSGGTTQAFLKEWVHRAVQIATERLGPNDSQLKLQVADFTAAMKEMRRFAEGSTGQIIGFHL